MNHHYNYLQAPEKHHDRLLDRVRKLLAKAEDESVTPPEAQALTAKAAELMAKYGIDRALLADRPGWARTARGSSTGHGYAHITLSMLALAWLATSRAQAVKGEPAPTTRA